MKKKKKTGSPLAKFFSASFAVVLTLASVGSVYAEVSDTELSVEPNTADTEQTDVSAETGTDAEQNTETVITTDNKAADETDIEGESDVLDDPAAETDPELNADENLEEAENPEDPVIPETDPAAEETAEETADDPAVPAEPVYQVTAEDTVPEGQQSIQIVSGDMVLYSADILENMNVQIYDENGNPVQTVTAEAGKYASVQLTQNEAEEWEVVFNEETNILEIRKIVTSQPAEETAAETETAAEAPMTLAAAAPADEKVLVAAEEQLVIEDTDDATSQTIKKLFNSLNDPTSKGYEYFTASKRYNKTAELDSNGTNFGKKISQSLFGTTDVIWKMIRNADNTYKIYVVTTDVETGLTQCSIYDSATSTSESGTYSGTVTADDKIDTSLYVPPVVEPEVPVNDKVLVGSDQLITVEEPTADATEQDLKDSETMKIIAKLYNSLNDPDSKGYQYFTDSNRYNQDYALDSNGLYFGQQITSGLFGTDAAFGWKIVRNADNTYSIFYTELKYADYGQYTCSKYDVTTGTLQNGYCTVGENYDGDKQATNAVIDAASFEEILKPKPIEPEEPVTPVDPAEPETPVTPEEPAVDPVPEEKPAEVTEPVVQPAADPVVEYVPEPVVDNAMPNAYTNRTATTETVEEQAAEQNTQLIINQPYEISAEVEAQRDNASVSRPDYGTVQTNSWSLINLLMSVISIFLAAALFKNGAYAFMKWIAAGTVAAQVMVLAINGFTGQMTMIDSLSAVYVILTVIAGMMTVYSYRKINSKA